MNRSTSMYQDMASRTGSSIYIGVVGPVRTGKSTFIKRFMETQVLPNIENDYRRERARDELPQSGSGRTIMTAEPKFVPEEAAEVRLPDGTSFSVRLIDCVGYMVPGAVGQFEDLAPRMVMTPWYDHEIPMTEAAELGTRKVICDHSTVGIVVTTDGSVTDIPRSDYLEAEERVIRELQELGKPFVVLVNSLHPEEARPLAEELQQKYGVRCLAVNCLELGEGDLQEILRSLLYEFPVQELQLFSRNGWRLCRRSIPSQRAFIMRWGRRPNDWSTSGSWRAAWRRWSSRSRSDPQHCDRWIWGPAWGRWRCSCPEACSTIR